MDPVDGLSKLGPARRHIPRTTGAEVAAKSIADIADMLMFHQKAREMTASYCRRMTGMSGGARQAARDANGIEPGRYSDRSLATRAAYRGQAVGEFGGAGVDAQAENMQRMAVPADGDLDAGNQHDIDIAGGLRRLRETTGFVVISQREQPDTSGCRAAHQIRRL